MNSPHRFLRALVALSVAASLSLAAPLTAIAAPHVKVPAATLMTMDGDVLWSRQPDVRRRTASTIKLLNALVVRDVVASLDTTVTVPRQAAAINEGDVHLMAGQTLKIRQLLEMMLVASANDAAEAIAIRLAGSESAYVAMMNAKAKSLGLVNTHAADPHGLSRKQYSSASDLTVLARRVMADPVLRAIVGKRSVSVPRPHRKTRIVASTDHLLGVYAGMEGVKTGFTNPAGWCFIGAAKRGDIELLGVVLGAKSQAGRFAEMRRLLDWGFAHTHVRTLVSTDTTMGPVVVEGADGPAVTVHASNTVARPLLDWATFETTVTLPATVAAPVERGQQLGTVEVGRGGVRIALIPLVADADVAARPSNPLTALAALVAALR